MKLFEELGNQEIDSVLTPCGSCKMQIKFGTGLDVKNPMKILWEAYGNKC